MPHFRLEEEEATQLAAYLLANSRQIKRHEEARQKDVIAANRPPLPLLLL